MGRSRMIYGIGINDADYRVTKNERINGAWKIVWQCPYYITWKNMLGRCYSDADDLRDPTYKGCSVCDEWLTFSNFKSWMEQQEWKGKHLDKDLLRQGNSVYCPEYCIFVNAKINTFITDRGNDRGVYMLGVYRKTNTNKLCAQCNNPFNGKRENLGYFTDELEAHLTWKRRKHELACMLADSEYCHDPRLAEALRTRYL